MNRWWPSRRLGFDPLQDLCVDGRYRPVSIANWKLIPSVARTILAKRTPQPLSFAFDQRLTVVIPYRDREEHLRRLMPELEATLERQAIRHRVLVVEQEAGGLFNRGRLLNIGMHYAADETDYYCLHDVDAVPLNANYASPSQPLRLVHRIVTGSGEATTRERYYFSGAVSIRKEQAFAVNGFSNEYWGWGKEDDDFFFRLLLAGCLCYYDNEGVFLDLPNPSHQHVVRKSASTPPHVRINRKRRSLLLRGFIDPTTDGLSTLQYQVVERSQAREYERIRVRWR
ncbi:MAG TPA: galactosyltransferase-related protein [Steroidobacteraceae bacterium]